MIKKPPANAGDMGLVPGSGRSLGEGNDNPLQYSCLGNPMERGAWLTIVHGVTKSWTRLNDSVQETHKRIVFIEFFSAPVAELRALFMWFSVLKHLYFIE